MLIADYHKTNSVKKQLEYIKSILIKHGLSHTVCNKIARELLVIPPGTKSHIRGYRFNQIIKKEIQKCLRKLKLDKDVVFEVEKKHCKFHEIPDWVITKGKKTLVGYNQISLFGGGHQLNRGSK